MRCGFPAYITSVGWLKYSDDKVKKVCQIFFLNLRLLLPSELYWMWLQCRVDCSNYERQGASCRKGAAARVAESSPTNRVGREALGVRPCTLPQKYIFALKLSVLVRFESHLNVASSKGLNRPATEPRGQP